MALCNVVASTPSCALTEGTLSPPSSNACAWASRSAVSLWPWRGGGGAKKCLRSGLPILLYVAFYRGQRHPEGPHDLALGGRAVDDELAGEQPETPQILRLVGEDRQMAVKVDHLGITALES